MTKPQAETLKFLMEECGWKTVRQEGNPGAVGGPVIVESPDGLQFRVRPDGATESCFYEFLEPDGEP